MSAFATTSVHLDGTETFRTYDGADSNHSSLSIENRDGTTVSLVLSHRSGLNAAWLRELASQADALADALDSASTEGVPA